MRRIGVSKLVYILFYNSLERYRFIKPLPDGLYFHRRLGFDQNDVKVQFYYKHNGEIWLIMGKPDRVEFQNGTVVISELKTIRREKSRDIMGTIGYAQANIYAYGLAKNFTPVVRVYVFNVEKDDRPVLWYEGPSDTKYAEKIIKKALDRILEEEEMKRKLMANAPCGIRR